MPINPKQLYQRIKLDVVQPAVNQLVDVIDQRLESNIDWDGIKPVTVLYFSTEQVKQKMPTTVLLELQKIYNEFDWKLQLCAKLSSDMRGEEYVSGYELVMEPK